MWKVPIGISPFFDKYRGGSTPPPTSLIQSWYDSLSVKPSEGLWADLNTLVNTLNAAGKWDELDFFAMIAAMETDEQRLRPLKTTSGLDITAVNSPTLNVNGAAGNGSSSYLDLNWNPTLHGVKFTLNNAFHGGYTSTAGTSGRAMFGGLWTSNASNYVFEGTTSSNMTINGTLASNGGLSGVGFRSVYRVSSTSFYWNFNGVSSSVLTGASINIPNMNYYGLCSNRRLSDGSPSAPLFYGTAINRGYFFGSSSLGTDAALYNALNTFFAARGLTTF